MFEWKEEFSVGVQKFDEQHKKMLEIGRELYLTLDNTDQGFDQYDKILELLQEMKDYTSYHFKSEEELMEKHDYPRLEEHREHHQGFVEELNKIDPQEIDLSQKETTLELLDFVANWVENHILGEDQKYVDFFADKL